MFEFGWIDDLDATEASDHLARSKDLVIAAEAEQFVLAAHWADLHAGDFVDECRAQLPGMPRLVPSGPDGCPEIEEFAPAELGVLLGRSAAGGANLVRDAVTVRHRHPQLWAGIRAGSIRVWLATKVARRCATAQLNAQQARWVDEQTTPYLSTLPVKRFLDLVEAKIIEADPDAAEERARAKELAKFVHAGLADEQGMRTLVARASAGDIVYVVAVLDRIATILAEQGDPEPVQVRRATALRVLANPARALALLTGAALDAGAQREAACGPEAGLFGDDEGVVDEIADDDADRGYPKGDASWMRDAEGLRVPVDLRRADLQPLDLERLGLDQDLGLHLVPDPRPSGGGVPGGVEEALDPTSMRALADSLRDFDAAAFDPLVVLHVHVTDTAIGSGKGVARVEELGPAVLAEVRSWLHHPYCPDHLLSQVHLRPVLDADAIRPVDAYEFPTRMSELASIRVPYEVFPFGTLASRSSENDHPVPYRWTADGRPAEPGQTSLSNNAKLGRFRHRIKTHGGWTLVQPAPGEYWWRTRHGHWFRVDRKGTHALGRDPALDARWLDTDRGEQPAA